YVKWYVDVYVNDTQGNPVSSANINLMDSLYGVNSSTLTNISGWTSRMNVTEYFENFTGKFFFTNYTVTASKTGYISAFKQVNLTTNAVRDDNTFIFLTLGKTGGGGGGGVECGDGTCDSSENCTNCPQDCHYCGDGCCHAQYGENYSNCWKDCCYPEGVTRPVLANHSCCPGLNTVIPFDMNCVANQQGVCAGCEAIGAVTCVKCGNDVCGLGENYCNCPQDCLGNVTNCSQLPKLDAQISWIDSSQNVRLNWAATNPILRTNILAADKVQGQNNLSNFSLKAESIQGTQWQGQIPELLKFFQVIAKVKIGNQQGECKPECWQYYQGVARPGWVDPCTEEFLKQDSCAAHEPQCCFIKTRSEGWYAVDDCKSADPSVNLITYAQCEPGEYALACNQSSDIFTKFTQPLVYNEPKRGTPNTSINWLVYMPPQGLAEHNTEELLNSGIPLDYIAYWNASRQLQYGSARGNSSYQGYSYGFLMDLMDSLSKLFPGQYLDMFGKGYGGSQGQNEIVITGPFNLEQGKPYFISATMPYNWTYVGKVPERVTFEFKYGPENSFHENYIVLPLDTQIKKASQLCKICVDNTICDDPDKWILDQSESAPIKRWDPTNQTVISDSIRTCLEIRAGLGDFSLEPGMVYKIKVQRNANWQQA
ncbi:MAG: carboxypeptidase-like regulatory domain-containing protein, partial [Candidatus Pacearchaeota archaeon]